MAVTLERPPDRVVPTTAPPEPPVQPEQTGSGSYFKNEVLILISAPLLKYANLIESNGNLIPVKPLSIQEEVITIISSFKKLDMPVEFDIKVRVATHEALDEVFAPNNQPLIIHFIGHGTQDEENTALLLEDNAGIASPLNVDEFRMLLAPRANPPCQLAVLNACHSQGLASVLVDAGVPHVIAINTNDEILDEASRAFSRRFYYSIFSNSKIDQAFQYGRDGVLRDKDLKKILDPRTLQSINLREALKFSLLPENSFEHNQQLKYQSLKRGNIVQPSWRNTNIPSTDKTFVGRRLDLHRIGKDFIYSTSSCLVIHGMGGMGKTALALAAGRWQHERNHWDRGVWLFKLRDVEKTSTVRSRIANELKLPENSVESNSALAKALDHQEILLILDDLDGLLQLDTKNIAGLLNDLCGCQSLQLLVTARRSLPGSVFHKTYELERMSYGDSQLAFIKYAQIDKKKNLGKNWQNDFDALIQFLDGYPFPIRLAASYMKETPRCTVSKLWRDLQQEWREVLHYPDYPEDRDTSLRSTLQLSFQALPQSAKDIFPLLSLFPAGLTEESSSFILDKTLNLSSSRSLLTLLRFSMAEDSGCGAEWRAGLPEPARRFAEEKLTTWKGVNGAMKVFAPRTLDFFYLIFLRQLRKFSRQEQSQNDIEILITKEQSNLKRFLDWGYSHEQTNDGICRSARLTAALSNYWQLVVPGEDPMPSFIPGLESTRRNHDRVGEAQMHQAVGDLELSKQGLNVAKQSYSRALLIYEEVYTNLTKGIEAADIKKSIGDIHRICQQIRKSLAAYVESAKLYEKSGETLEAAILYKDVGDVLNAQNSSKLALRSYEKALGLFRLLKEELQVVRLEELIREIRKAE